MNVEEVLKDFGIQIHTKRVEHFEVLCPFHNDTNPSGSTVHHKTGFFHCFVCQKKATFNVFLAKSRNFTLAQVKLKLGVKSDCKHPVSPTDVEQWHINIWKHPDLLEALYYRQVKDELIRKYRWGVNNFGMERRITIPIQNDVGEYANVRMYLPGATSRKFFNSGSRDAAKVRLYPIEQMEYDQVLVCAGEAKAIVAADILNKYEIGAVAPTCGENVVWPSELSHRFNDKLVYVCSDVDEAGLKSAEIRCRMLKSHVRELHKVVLPIPDIPKGDINDFVRLGGDLYELLLHSPEWQFVPGGVLPEELIEDVPFREAFHRDNVGKRVRTTVIVSAISNKSYNVPSVVEVQCQRDQEYCLTCDVNNQAYSHNTDMKIAPEHRLLLALISEKETIHPSIYKECFHIPKQCQQCVFLRKQEYSVDEVQIDEQLEATSRDTPLTQKYGFIVNGPQNLENQSYLLTGRLWPSPKDQVSNFLASKCENTLDSLDAYQADSSKDLDIFCPHEWTVEGIQTKLDEVYSDLEANVTHIWRRRDYHLAIDLVYHSVLHMNFLGDKQMKGWLELLCIGDTRQGKSKVADSLKDHYGLGMKIDCKNLSQPGLTVGIDNKGNKHFIIFGAMPRSDKKLLIFEELKGMNPKIFQSLTEVRSSGFVQVTKIQSGIRSARVRIIALSNPVGDREISNYTFGIEAAMNLIGTNEDLSRFDFVVILGKQDLPDIPELRDPPRVQHKFLPDLCQRLVLKAWKCDEIHFQDEQHVMNTTKQLLEKYGDGPPVLDPNSSHIKIAKISAALAARTNSYNEHGLFVRNCHVEYIAQYLDRLYSSPSCRLDAKSRMVKEAGLLRDKENLLVYLRQVPNMHDIAVKLYDCDIITANFVRDLVGDFHAGSLLFSRLVQANALTLTRQAKYVKTSEFMELLKTEKFEPQQPKYIREKF